MLAHRQTSYTIGTPQGSKRAHGRLPALTATLKAITDSQTPGWDRTRVWTPSHV